MDSAKIFIDTDNEITFILEKVLSAKSDRVCLVVPDRASVFTSISGLKLIKRVIDQSTKLLVVVTLDESGADLAKRAGLIVVARVGEINEALWEKAQKSKFEFVKKKKNRTYYLPEEEKKSDLTQIKTEDSVLTINEIVANELNKNDESLQPSLLIQENNPDAPSEQINSYEEVTDEVNDIPQVRIRIDEKEVEDLKIEERKEELLSRPKSSIDQVIFDEGFEKDEKHVKKEPARMRKVSENPSGLSFTFGEDINPEKKK